MKMHSNIKSFIALIAAVTAISSSFSVAISQPDSERNQVRTDFFDGQFGRAIEDYKRLPADLQNLPDVSFFAGQSYWRRHDFDQADKLLRVAVNGNLRDQQHERAQKFIQQISTIKSLTPQYYGDFGVCRIYAAKNTWSTGIANQMEHFHERAKQAFNGPIPPVSFYLFDARPAYDNFCSAMSGTEPTTGHRGTGTFGVVLFCKYFPTGKEIGNPDISDLYARILHEYGHALCNTIYGDRYQSDVPQWLNEAMADLMGAYYSKNMLANSAALVQKAAKEKAAPSYEDLCRRLYADSNLGYPMGNLILYSLMGNQDVSVLGKIINAAQAQNGNFEIAVKQVTGKDPRDAYRSVVATYWKH